MPARTKRRAESEDSPRPKGPQDPLGKLVARRIAETTPLDGPNEAFRPHLQNPV